MNASKRFDIMAEAFYLETGVVAPGKDDALGQNREFRDQQWKEWLRKMNRTFDCIINAIERVTGKEI